MIDGIFIGVEKILDGGRRRFFQVYHQKYSCGMKHMRPKNGPLSGLQRKKWSPIIQKALLVSDSKFCVLYSAHYCRKHIVNTSLSAYVLLDFCVCVCVCVILEDRQAKKRKEF